MNGLLPGSQLGLDKFDSNRNPLSSHAIKINLKFFVKIRIRFCYGSDVLRNFNNPI